MNWLSAISIILLFLSPLLSAVLALYAWQKRATRGATSLTALLVAVTQWGLVYALELLAGDNLPLKSFWAGFKYLGVATAPVAWLAFSFEYTNQDKWLTRRNILLLLIIPTVTAVLCLTNRYHQWVWSQEQILPAGPFQALGVRYEFWFWVHAAYTYLLLATGSVLLLRFLYQSENLYQQQVRLLLISVFIPWVGNTLSITGFTPLPHFDLTSIAFTVSGLLITVGLRFFRLLDVMPIARAAVFENLNDGIIIIDAQKRMVDINPAAQNLFNISAHSDPIGRSMDEVFHQWPNILQYLQSQQNLEKETILSIGEPPRYYALKATTLKNAHGTPVGQLALLRDVTEAQLLNKMRDDLTHTMIHDLRNPLGAIKAALDMLLEHHEEKPDKRNLRVINIAQNGVDHMLNLVNAILDINRLESGKMPLNYEAVPLVDLVQEALEVQSTLASQKRIQLENQIARDLSLVWADYRLVHRIFQNLIGNGIKFTPENGLIRVAAEVTPTTPPMVRISVSDNGPGIPEEIRGRLFQKFVSGPQRGHGSGLGLAFCRLAVEAHGGQIEAASENRKGTTFTFTLPVAPSPI